MSSLFKSARAIVFALAYIFAIIILGIAANFATVLLPLHRVWIIYALVASAVTVLALMIIALRSTPRVEIIVIFILAVLMLALAAYTEDVIGHTQCEDLSGRLDVGNGKSYSAASYCRQTKVVEAFAWADFALFVIWFFIILRLAVNAAAKGYHEVWNSDITDLAWFNEDENADHPPPPSQPIQYAQVPPQQPQSNASGQTWTYPSVAHVQGQPIYQMPGHSVVITTGPNGQHNIQQIPVEHTSGSIRS